MNRALNITGIIIILILTMNACDAVKDNQENTLIQTKEADELFGSFIKEDSLPFSFSSENLSNNYWRAIDYSSILKFIDPSLKDSNNRIQRIVDSLNLVNEKREIYEPLETQYDEKYWDDEDLEYRYTYSNYRANRFFILNKSIAILIYIKRVGNSGILNYPEWVGSPLILATHQASTGERIDSIQIDYHQLIESLEEGTGHLIIKEDGLSMKYGEVEKEIKIDNEGNFGKK